MTTYAFVSVEGSAEFNKVIADFFTDLYYQKGGLYVGNGVRCFKLGIREYEKFSELSEIAEIYVWEAPNGKIRFCPIIIRDVWKKENY